MRSKETKRRLHDSPPRTPAIMNFIQNGDSNVQAPSNSRNVKAINNYTSTRDETPTTHNPNPKAKLNGDTIEEINQDPKAIRKSFQATYNKLQKKRQESNKIIIERIYTHFNQKSNEELIQYHARNWHLLYKEMSEIFSQEECDNIFQHVKALPLDDEEYEAIQAFLYNDCLVRKENELDDLLKGFIERAQSCSLAPATYMWIFSALLCFQRLLKTRKILSGVLHCENWWSINLWADAFDGLMLHIDGTNFERYALLTK